MAQIQTAASTGLGALSTLAARTAFDEPRDASLTRPSVMYGVGVGGLSILSAMLVDNGTMSAPVGNDRMYTEFAYNFGYSALAAGLYSAFSPRGEGFQAPKLA